MKLHETKYSQKENIEFEKMKQKRKIFSQLNDNERQKFIELRIGSIGKSTDTKKKLKLLKEPPNDIELSIISD
ncbi:MAG: hypothetical protein C0602_08445 [Denitrovibrio sp.]|nr:MAG: hypothetical protein C0602_08445 [Denitrovibrio sp.]